MKRVPDVDPVEAMPDLVHALRNPLSALKAGISLLRHTANPDAKALRLLDLMMREVGRLDATINDAQRYFRLDAGRPRRVRVAEAVAEACAAVGPEAARSGVELAVGGPEDAVVRIDRGHLLFALAELTANACRHSSPGGRVRVSWRRSRDLSVAVAVTDSGAGIPASHAREVGRPYFTTASDRTGLGVATVARVCGLAGGSLRWAAVAGGGCRFTMELPKG